MKFAVDTHALVWHLAEDRRLSRRAGKLLGQCESGASTAHVSTIVLMEISMLEALGRIIGSYPELRDQLERRPGFVIEPLTAEDVDEARSLAKLHDPFDRMIAGTSIRLGLPLLTRDATMTEDPRIDTIW